MKTKLKITEITIRTAGEVPINLTMEEAKDLYTQLHELFGEKYISSAPVIINPYQWPYPIYWIGDNTVTYESNSTLEVSYSGEPV